MTADIPPVAWTPKFSITPAISRSLMQIEAARALVDNTPSRRARAYSLSEKYRQYIGSLSAIIQEGEKKEL